MVPFKPKGRFIRPGKYVIQFRYGSGHVSGQVTFQVSTVQVEWTSIRISFRSTDFWSNCLLWKNKQLCKKLRVGYGSVWVNSGFAFIFG